MTPVGEQRESQPSHSNNQSLNLSRWLPAIGIKALLPGNWSLVERKDDKCLSNLKGVLLDRRMDIYSWYFDKNVSRSVWDSGRCTETDSGQWLHSMVSWELHPKAWESSFMYFWFFPPYSLKDITGVISVLIVICSNKKMRRTVLGSRGDHLPKYNQIIPIVKYDCSKYLKSAEGGKQSEGECAAAVSRL